MTKKRLRQFDPYEMARLDTEMWRAYYGRKFFRLTGLLVRLMRVQFKLGWLQAALAAYYSGRAAAAFRKQRDVRDYAWVLAHLRVFFRLVARSCQEGFDPETVAALELRWWLVHRYPKRYAESLEQALAAAMAAIYTIDPTLAQPYARDRAAAMHVRDIARWRTRTEPDWGMIRQLLERSYIALHDAVRK